MCMLRWWWCLRQLGFTAGWLAAGFGSWVAPGWQLGLAVGFGSWVSRLLRHLPCTHLSCGRTLLLPMQQHRELHICYII